MTITVEHVTVGDVLTLDRFQLDRAVALFGPTDVDTIIDNPGGAVVVSQLLPHQLLLYIGPRRTDPSYVTMLINSFDCVESYDHAIITVMEQIYQLPYNVGNSLFFLMSRDYIKIHDKHHGEELSLLSRIGHYQNKNNSINKSKCLWAIPYTR